MLCIYHELQRTDFILVIILVWYFHVFVGLWPNCLWWTGPVWGWKRHQQRKSRGTAQSVWGEARNQPSVAGGGAGAGAQGGGRRKWCELLSQRMGLHKQKLKKWCELLSENEAQQEEKYMNLCQRTRLSKVKKKKMWTLVQEKNAHCACVRLGRESDNEIRLWLYWTLGVFSLTMSVKGIIHLVSVLLKILTPFLFKCLIYFSTDTSRNININWHMM